MMKSGEGEVRSQNNIIILGGGGFRENREMGIYQREMVQTKLKLPMRRKLLIGRLIQLLRFHSTIRLVGGETASSSVAAVAVPDA